MTLSQVSFAASMTASSSSLSARGSPPVASPAKLRAEPGRNDCRTDAIVGKTPFFCVIGQRRKKRGLCNRSIYPHTKGGSEGGMPLRFRLPRRKPFLRRKQSGVIVALRKTTENAAPRASSDASVSAAPCFVARGGTEQLYDSSIRRYERFPRQICVRRSRCMTQIRPEKFLAVYGGIAFPRNLFFAALWSRRKRYRQKNKIPIIIRRFYTNLQ